MTLDELIADNERQRAKSTQDDKATDRAVEAIVDPEAAAARQQKIDELVELLKAAGVKFTVNQGDDDE